MRVFLARQVDVLAVELVDGDGALHRSEVVTYEAEFFDEEFAAVFDGSSLSLDSAMPGSATQDRR